MFSNPKVIQYVKANFVAAVGDDWYRRRQDDETGRFFRKVADQGPKKNPNSNRQGIYVFTADGTLLGYHHTQDAEHSMAQLSSAIDAWSKLPSKARKKGRVIADLKARDPMFNRAPPEKGMVANVYSRVLSNKDGVLSRGVSAHPGGNFAARDHLWLTWNEVLAMVGDGPGAGERTPLTNAVADRLIRFHLLDNTRGEAEPWKRADIQENTLKLELDGPATSEEHRYTLSGNVAVVTAEKTDFPRSFRATVQGKIRVVRDRVQQFDLVAVGLHTGTGQYTLKALPGPQWLGISFELAAPDDPSRAVPPQAARYPDVYFGKKEVPEPVRPGPPEADPNKKK